MTLEHVTWDSTGIRLIFDTSDPQELTAHLETLDVLQVRRPRHLQSPRCMWAADIWLSDNRELHPIRVWASPEDVDFALAEIVRNQAAYFRCEAKLCNVRRDLN